jgi:sugar/nucleoside kinase (ribokinase family)
MARKHDVLLVGDYFLDLVFTGLPAMPELGQEVFGTGFEMLIGGAFNTAAAMRRLGLRVAWAGDFGSDDFSALARRHAEEEGVDMSLSAFHARPLRRVTVAASFPHDRAFISYVDPEPPVPAAFKALPKASADVVCIGGTVWGGKVQAGLLLARARKMRIMMDGNGSDAACLSDPNVRRALGSVDAYLPNLREAMRLTGACDARAALHALGKLCRLVVIKAGGDGAYGLAAGGEPVHGPAIPVTPVDTTGAGDSFNAGFVKAWLEGRPLAECLAWGNAVGGLSTTAPGVKRVITAEDVAPYLR